VSICKIISWNVNGLNKKGGNSRFLSVFKENADIFCLQETKYPQSEIHAEYKSPSGFRKDFSPIVTTLESGLALYSRKDYETCTYGLEAPLHDGRSRIQTTDFGTFFLISVFTPESGPKSAPLRYKLMFLDELTAHVRKLRSRNLPVILCGDFNIAHTDLDVFPAERLAKSNGISPEERLRLDTILGLGFVDAFRHGSPGERTYSYWREKNSQKEQDLGWRYDYFFVSEDLADETLKSGVLPRNDFSDHAPAWLEVTVPDRA
jgi:exodeoxyribonuclease III